MKSYFSPQDLAAFDRDGFVIVKGMYSSQEIREISAWIDEISSRKPEVGKQMVYYEDSLLEKGKKVLSRIEKFTDFHAELRNMVYAEKMMSRAAELIGDRPLLFKEKINFKLPGGGGFTPHQDIQPGWDEYAPYFISVLITVDQSTTENGCLELSAGHHKRGLIGRKWQPLEGKELEGIDFEYAPMEPGDVAYFDCFVPHQSKPNLTDKPRRNIYLTYNRAQDGDHREQYFADKRKSYPPDYEREPGKVYVFKV